LAFQSANDSSSSVVLPVGNFRSSGIKRPLPLERPRPKSDWSVTSNASYDRSPEKSEEQNSLLVNPGSESFNLSSSNTDAGLSVSGFSTASWSNGGTSSGDQQSDVPSSPNSAQDGGGSSITRKDYFGVVDSGELGTIEEKPVCLVAEDNELCQKIANKMLGKEYVVEIAANGRIAVDTVMASPDRFNIIIMDIIMPEMDGIQATIELRKQGVKIPIIA
jgi:Response regulator receiver domain